MQAHLTILHDEKLSDRRSRSGRLHPNWFGLEADQPIVTGSPYSRPRPAACWRCPRGPTYAPDPESPPGGRYADTRLQSAWACTTASYRGSWFRPGLGHGPPSGTEVTGRAGATTDRIDRRADFRRMPLGRWRQSFSGLEEGSPKYAPSNPAQLPARLP